jgi:hypothetical protein
MTDDINNLRAQIREFKEIAREFVEVIEDDEKEISRLRARVEELEKVRAAAQALDGYGFGWLDWEEKFETLRAALKEAKP